MPKSVSLPWICLQCWAKKDEALFGHQAYAFLLRCCSFIKPGGWEGCRARLLRALGSFNPQRTLGVPTLPPSQVQSWSTPKIRKSPALQWGWPPSRNVRAGGPGPAQAEVLAAAGVCPWWCRCLYGRGKPPCVTKSSCRVPAPWPLLPMVSSCPQPQQHPRWRCPSIGLRPPALLYLPLLGYRVPKSGVSPKKDYGQAHAEPWETTLDEVITR